MQAPKTALKKSNKQRMIGLEYENQLVVSKNGYNIQKKDIQRIWKEFIKDRKWKPIYDQYSKVLLGASRKIKSGEVVLNTDTAVSILELAMPPRDNVREAEKDWKMVFKDILGKLNALGYTPISLSTFPHKMRRPKGKDLYSLKTDKGLYALMNDRLPRHNIMLCVAAHQVAVDVSIDEAVRAMNLLMKIGGFLVALTANSPIADDRVLKWKEVRHLCWKTPWCNDDYKNPEKIFGGVPERPYNGLSDYFKRAWSATPLIVIKNGEWGRIKDWRVSGWEYLTGGRTYDGITAEGKPMKLKAEESDLNLMMILVWQDVKPHIVIDAGKVDLKKYMKAVKEGKLEDYLNDKVLSCYLEVRTCPVAPKGEEMALPALVMGLANNLSGLERFYKGFTWKEGIELKDILSIRGMDYIFKGKHMAEYLKELVNIAEKGLEKRKAGEEKYLAPFYKRIKEKKTPADKVIEIFNKKGVKALLDEIKY